jgi:hypothetical protein
MSFGDLWRSSREQIRKAAMIEKAYGFSTSAIDELNKDPGSQPLSAKQFALLMVGLVALLLLLYCQSFGDTAVGTAARVGPPQYSP